MRPINRVLEKLAGYKLQHPDQSKEQWNSLCPAHDDAKQSLTISVGEDNRVILHCFANCTADAVVAALGLKMADLFEAKPGVTLAELAASKRLPAKWLQDKCGLRDLSAGEGVGIPYTDEDGRRLFIRVRFALRAKEGTRQPRGEKLQVYGQWRLKEIRKAKEVVIVEGESDCWTLWHAGFQALGMPGAAATASLHMRWLDGVETVYVWQEPGAAGQSFVDRLAKKLRKVKFGGHMKLLRHVEHKDPSAWFIANQETFSAAFREQMTGAEALPEPAGAARYRAIIQPDDEVPSGEGLPGLVPGRFALTDMGNAQRLVHRHGQNLRWVKSWKSWLAWDCGIWVADADNAAVRAAQETVRAIYGEGAACQDSRLRQQIVEHAVSSESARAVEAMVKLSKVHRLVEIDHKRLDADAWMLSCPNGTLDLTTGILSEHRRERLITKQCPTVYDPSAACPEWEKFLRQIFDDQDELIAYVQRLMGYCLTGDVSTHLLAVFWGGGGNGKGTLLNTFLQMMGDNYSGAAVADLLMRQRGERHPAEIADLHGKRLVVCQETEDGCRLNESLVKHLTGGDALKARRMRENFWQFYPTHKLILSTNYRPVIRGTDRGIWRRLRLVPFTVTFDGAKEDRGLAGRLRAEASGILTWAVRGCLAWQRQGEGVPEEVLVATKEYQVDEDFVQRFLQEECLLSPLETARANDLYHAFCSWVERAGETGKLSQKRFGERLTAAGLTRHASNGTYYRGVRLIQASSGASSNGNGTYAKQSTDPFDLSSLDE